MQCFLKVPHYFILLHSSISIYILPTLLLGTRIICLTMEALSGGDHFLLFPSPLHLT